MFDFKIENWFYQAKVHYFETRLLFTVESIVVGLHILLVLGLVLLGLFLVL